MGARVGAILATVVYLIAMATRREGSREHLATNVGSKEGGVDGVPQNRFLLMVSPKHHVICQSPIAPYFRGFYDETHVCQHVCYLVRVGLGHYCDIGGKAK